MKKNDLILIRDSVNNDFVDGVFIKQLSRNEVLVTINNKFSVIFTGQICTQEDKEKYYKRIYEQHRRVVEDIITHYKIDIETFENILKNLKENNANSKQ